MNAPSDVNAASAQLTHIVLVRHGETTWNQARRVQGTLDSPLSALGHLQAEAMAQVLAAEPLSFLYSSDLGRTQDTAAALARLTGLSVQLDARLRERCYGDLQAKTWPEIEIEFPEAYRRLNSRDPEFFPPQGESAIVFRERVLAAVTEIAAQHVGERGVIVTHGGVVGMMYRYTLDIALSAERDYALLNASINRFKVVQGRWYLDTWGDVSHLSQLDQTDGRD